jgi:hypothetical protein
VAVDDVKTARLTSFTSLARAAGFAIGLTPPRTTRSGPGLDTHEAPARFLKRIGCERLCLILSGAPISGSAATIWLPRQ